MRRDRGTPEQQPPQLPSDYRNQIAEELALLSGEAPTPPPPSSSVPRLVVPGAESFTRRADEEPVVMSEEMAASLRADAAKIGQYRQLAARQPRPTLPSGGLWGNNPGLPQPPQLEGGIPTPYWRP